MSYVHIIDEVIQVEGGYVDHPDDRGGPTNFGITLQTLRNYRRDPKLTAADVKNMRRAEAFEIYEQRYVREPRFHDVMAITPLAGAKCIDIGVNAGPSAAGRFLQRALNLLSGLSLGVDGRVGPQTMGALSSYMSRRRAANGDEVLTRVLNVYQGQHYINIVERDSSQRSFIYGWFAHRIQ